MNNGPASSPLQLGGVAADCRGFSLIELLIAMAIMTVVMGGIFQLMNLAMQRSSTEQARLDMFQEAREFMDQIARDLRHAGYPNARHRATIVLESAEADSDVAAGLVKVDTGDIWFEGDVEGTGFVSVVQYHLDNSTANNCPCLKRSQKQKQTGNPLTGQLAPEYQTEVQNVKNMGIFTAYASGTAVGLPVTFTANSGATIATVDTVQAMLTVESPYIDPQTRQKPISTLVTTVKLDNCSMAAAGEKMSCF